MISPLRIRRGMGIKLAQMAEKGKGGEIEGGGTFHLIPCTVLRTVVRSKLEKPFKAQGIRLKVRISGCGYPFYGGIAPFVASLR